ncbi:lipid-binding SYLF domain-containing protein [Myxococcus stipitatus]|uniref:lipid-binding SYLF domain-containing protein n=1 Tax=Myxococcus stipitatus TaxID=83455 RepID=UPI0030D2ABBD
MKPEQEKVLHEEVVATLDRLQQKNPELKEALQQARGYAVFPSLGRASLVLGGSYGHGEVFEKGKPIGFATLTQMTVGVQVGGQTMSELIFFNDRDTLERFKGGKMAFAANASAVIMKAAASGTINYAKCTAHAYSRGGMLLEASLGGQKFTFIPPSSGGNGNGSRRGAAQAHDESAHGEQHRELPRRPMALATGLSTAAVLVTRLLKARAQRRGLSPG